VSLGLRPGECVKERHNILIIINTGNILKAVMTEEKFAKANVTKLTENISTLRISDLVVRLLCSLSY